MNISNLNNYFEYIIPQIGKLGQLFLDILQNWIMSTWQLSKKVLAMSASLGSRPALADIITLFLSVQMRIVRTFVQSILMAPIFTLGQQVFLILSQVGHATLALFQVSINSQVIQAFNDLVRFVSGYHVFLDYIVLIIFLFSIKWLVSVLSKLYWNYNILILILTIFMKFN